ncbi:MAG: energy-coupling factor ABC transporter ATP-binding protein [Erysipelotrichaceae bacterium]|jgi:energy-coupling factor transport system ATP-binding protein|nr:energy-coupling factor ABC transporter ATP-binding protein [Erysipelotrichaceae bacterium]
MSIQLQNVSFAYPDGTQAISNVSLEIQDGERLAIIGKNGAGKTTVVKLMNNLYQPLSGTLLVDDIDTKTKTTAQISHLVGYVFQNPDDQIFNKDVISELEYMPKYLKLDAKETKARIDEAVEFTGIKRYLKRNPYDIPYPIRKFVTIASVLVTKPKYLILDEPTAGQDRQGIQTLEHLMDTLQERGIGVITITHDMEFVANNFERVVVMAHANVIADASGREVFARDDIIAEAGIRKPQLGELASALKLKGDLLYLDELVEAIK